MTTQSIIAALLVLGVSAAASATPKYTTVDKAGFRSVITIDARTFALSKQPNIDLRHVSARTTIAGDKGNATLLINKVPKYTGTFDLTLETKHVTGPWAQQVGTWQPIAK